jgi:DNA-binding transcriptional ArsR family regulator
VDLLSQTFSALADPTRRAIVARLAAGDATVSELARPFDISGPRFRVISGFSKKRN